MPEMDISAKSSSVFFPVKRKNEKLADESSGFMLALAFGWYI
jgi:hypothetical protein